jgi:hypothetical protein
LKTKRWARTTKKKQPLPYVELHSSHVYSRCSNNFLEANDPIMRSDLEEFMGEWKK